MVQHKKKSSIKIWDNESNFKIFLSHKVSFKEETSLIKKELLSYGISSFVAHEDIHPTSQWQNEIENALDTMDGFVALMTEDYHKSYWTDQEVGYAFARKVPIIAIHLGKDPYGFLGKFQALKCDKKDIAEKITGLWINEDIMFQTYIRALENCNSFDTANKYSKILDHIETTDKNKINSLIKKYNENSELSGSFGFNGIKPGTYGIGLYQYILKWTGLDYKLDRNNKIIPPSDDLY